jgi:hypothetical protein
MKPEDNFYYPSSSKEIDDDPLAKYPKEMWIPVKNQQIQKETEFFFPKKAKEIFQQMELNKKLASSMQIGNTHYVTKTIQPWTAMESWMSEEEFEGFLRGNVIKYIARYKDKDGIKDILKAKHYLEKLLECLETRKQDAT